MKLVVTCDDFTAPLHFASGGARLESLAVPIGRVLRHNQHLRAAASAVSAVVRAANARREAGALSGALRLYESVLRSDPRNADALLHSANILRAAGRHEAALERLSRGRALYPARVDFAVLWADTLRESHRCAPAIDAYAAALDMLSRGAEESAEERPYSEDELDLLAVFYTVTKILYVCGFLQFVGPLVQLIEPCRGKRDLHLTLIRNENAYFLCVARLMEGRRALAPADLAAPPLYMVGDSHCLSAGWQPLALSPGGPAHLIRPYLVTGLKIWHMREETDFYPKRNFESVLAQVPDGARVVVLFGEIDCREGLLVAVDKCRYDDVAAAIRAVVALYLRVLVRLADQRRFRILVHPAAPVLNETRAVVMAFNAELGRALAELADARVRFLDLAPSLLGGDGALRPDYALDGTHLAPCYVPRVLEPAVLALCAAPSTSG
eukprot:m51a1_g9831 hypothetical protein (439) ;mRNA; r:1924617-1928164